MDKYGTPLLGSWPVLGKVRLHVAFSGPSS